ncbi:MAG: kinase-like domain-containing protein [Benjaminiella poitrasii]|nr:MAG: kinase-like domain-containing protein [Benjaminiella poitrasii]
MPHPRVSLKAAQSLLYTFIDNNSIQLVSILGIGAYGIVYLGYNKLNSCYYAVKLLTHINVSCREAEIHAYLSGHPNILKFEKVVQEPQVGSFLVLEYMPKGDLFVAITKNKGGIVGNNELIRHIFLQIIDAVQFCHQNNISHHDLKPENIMLGEHLEIKLADFGLATMNAVSTEFGCGSTFYFSPECQGESLTSSKHITKAYSTQKNDIWSLGVILINLTTGRNPWKQATMHNSTFATYVRNPRHFFRTILPNITEELEWILLRIFCLDPAYRISLPELRVYIQKCQFFTVPKSQPTIHKKKKTIQYNKLKIKPFCYNSNNTIACSDSVTETMLHYVGAFTDND